MKKIYLIVALIIATGSFTGCKKAGQYADDVWKAVDDKVDDIGKGKGKMRPKKQKRCSDCNGTGVVYDAYWNAYECPNCGGDGQVWF